MWLGRYRFLTNERNTPMSHPYPLQEYLPDEILDDRRSTREQLEQEIEKTERDLRETVARLRDELDELDSD